MSGDERPLVALEVCLAPSRPVSGRVHIVVLVGCGKRNGLRLCPTLLALLDGELSDPFRASDAGAAVPVRVFERLEVGEVSGLFGAQYPSELAGGRVNAQDAAFVKARECATDRHEMGVPGPSKQGEQFVAFIVSTMRMPASGVALGGCAIWFVTGHT